MAAFRKYIVFLGLKFEYQNMNSMKLVILLHLLYWSIHTKDESKPDSAFAFIFGVNWLWRCSVTASFGVFFYEINCNEMMNFMEFMSFLYMVSLFEDKHYSQPLSATQLISPACSTFQHNTDQSSAWQYYEILVPYYSSAEKRVTTDAKNEWNPHH